MIISHKHKFIFIKTVKTAGSSIEMALASICGPNDIITPLNPEEEVKKRELGLIGPQNYYLPLRKWNKKAITTDMLKLRLPRFYPHHNAITIQRYVDKDVWNNYYKFCFERNPFDKVISMYYYWKSLEKTIAEDVNEFISQGGLSHILNFEHYTIHGNIVLNDIFKFEEIDNALSRVTDKLNLSEALKLPEYRAKSQHKDKSLKYNLLLSDKSKKNIEIAFAREIRLFNYKFEN